MGRRWWVVATLMVGAAVVLGACSSDDSSSAPDPSAKVVLEAYGTAPAASADLEQAATIVQDRLGALDVRGASVKVKGQTLVATGTGVGEAAAKALQPGLLELRPVLAVLPPETPPGADEAAPADNVLPSRNISGDGSRYEVGPSALTGEGVTGVKAVPDPEDRPPRWSVNLSLAPAGADAFNRLASSLVAKPPPQNSVAIVLDGVVQSAPTFMTDQFEGGEVEISGSFTKAEAIQLATILRFGSVRVPLRIAG